MECPHCEHKLTPEEVKTLWGRYTANLRTVHRGGKEGRPRSKRRCPCGAMTRDRAAKRNHQCVASTHHPLKKKQSVKE